MIVPALSMKKPIDFNTVGEDDFDPGIRQISGKQDGNSLADALGSVSASVEELKLSNIP